MARTRCRVVYTDLDGLRHTVDVEAESVYEAGALALAALRRSEWPQELLGQAKQ